MAKQVRSAKSPGSDAQKEVLTIQNYDTAKASARRYMKKECERRESEGDSSEE